MWSVSVCGEEMKEEGELVKQSNLRYQKLCEMREGNDMYKDRGMQTYNDDRKTKVSYTTALLVQTFAGILGVGGYW